MVPVYAQSDSIINLLQELWGLISMPILACFAVGLLFKNVDYRAAIAAVIFGVFMYACFIWLWMPLHYIHMTFFTFFIWPTTPSSASSSIVDVINGSVVSGDALMNFGLQLPIMQPTSLLIFHLRS